MISMRYSEVEAEESFAEQKLLCFRTPEDFIATRDSLYDRAINISTANHFLGETNCNTLLVLATWEGGSGSLIVFPICKNTAGL